MSFRLNPKSSAYTYRVVIVDADPLLRVALASMITRVDGFTVTHSTGNFQAALEYVRRDQPDLVLIDIVVPWLTGLDVAKQMLSESSDLSVYVMSAHDYGEVVNHILELNITGFISKPVSPGELATILLRHRKNRPPRPSPALEKLRTFIRDKNFKSFNEQARMIASHLLAETNQNLKLLNEKLDIFYHTVVDDKPELEPAGPTDLLPLPDVTLLSVVSMVELILFFILDQAFKRSSLKRNPRLKKVFGHIDRNLGRSLCLMELVDHCFISQGHLSRTFKKNFQVSVMEYIHLKKMALAKAYFLLTERTVAEVADLTGYNERSYFGKVFKKFEKSTIQQFRQLTVRADTQAAMVMSHSHWKLLTYFGGEEPS
ncbi:MAG: response regulator [Deltaproteobacteria bacterium]|jgi:two-component system response regulator YesN|nr:response regulator [Deltaproteobacteria bacterium]